MMRILCVCDGVCGEKEKCGGGTFLESFFGI